MFYLTFLNLKTTAYNVKRMYIVNQHFNVIDCTIIIIHARAYSYATDCRCFFFFFSTLDVVRIGIFKIFAYAVSILKQISIGLHRTISCRRRSITWNSIRGIVICPPSPPPLRYYVGARAVKYCYNFQNYMPQDKWNFTTPFGYYPISGESKITETIRF